MDAIEALTTRVSPLQLAEPGPDEMQLKQILLAGASAPDHGRLQPWRFLIFKGDARSSLGELMAQSLKERESSVTEAALTDEKKKAFRAPVTVVVAAVLQESPKVPDIEQIVAAGAAAQNMLVASHALGFGGFWRTGPLAYDPSVKKSLRLAEANAIVGFLYIGSVGRAGRPRTVDVDRVTRQL